MLRSVSLLFLFALTACGGATPQHRQLLEAVAADLADDRPPTAVAFRFAGRSGANARLYRLPAMDEVAWTFDTPGLVVDRVVGFAADDDAIYVHSPAAEFLVLDLNSGRARTVDTNVTRAALDPTGNAWLEKPGGAIAQVIGRRVSVHVDSLPGTVEGLWGVSSTRALVAVTEADGRALLEISGEQIAQRWPLPRGPLAVAPWGDVAAVGTDSGIVLVDLTGDAMRFLPLGPATAIAFSASAHRLYAATADTQLVTIERFGLDVIRRRALPSRPVALRSDPLGRFLLARARDEHILLIGLTDSTLHRTAGAWDDDLPQVAPDGTVMLRRGGDVVIVSSTTFEQTALVTGGSTDRWLIAPWDPRRPALQVAREAQAHSTEVDQRLYVQVSSTSNPDWAATLARDLQLAGMKSMVLPPLENDVMYRVVLGPYPTREEAEEIGRTLNMPYWIFTDTQAGEQ